jgi:broad specificity phosphatase PhoE
MADLLDSNENIKTVYLVRHGDTVATMKGRICGHSDITLNDNGVYQAEVLAAWFSDMGIESIFSSPLARTVQTSDVIEKAVGLHYYYKKKENGKVKVIGSLEMRLQSFGKGGQKIQSTSLRQAARALETSLQELAERLKI